MSGFHQIANRALRMLPPETAHGIALDGLARGVGPRRSADGHDALAQTVWDMNFPNPVGVSAGFDKNAVAISGVMGLGTGFAEVGGVTPRPQTGNPRPRLFRLNEDLAVINRLGFNNDGAEAVHARLVDYRRAARDRRPVGVNLAANADSADPAEDFVALVRRFAPVADYLTIDVSCPNTENGQVFLDPGALDDLMRRLNEARAASGSAPAMLAKLAPDLAPAHLSELLAVLEAAAIDGMILCNTTTARPDSLRSPLAGERGGLSGRPLFARSTEMLRTVYAKTGGRIPLIGVGGIMSGTDAYAKIRAGASLVQLYTGLIFEGPGLIGRIQDDLAAFLARDGFSAIGEAVGADHR